VAKESNGRSAFRKQLLRPSAFAKKNLRGGGGSRYEEGRTIRGPPCCGVRATQKERAALKSSGKKKARLEKMSPASQRGLGLKKKVRLNAQDVVKKNAGRARGTWGWPFGEKRNVEMEGNSTG